MRRVLYVVLHIAVILGVPLTVAAQAPVANFSGTPISGCSPIVTQFTDLSTNNPTTWLWDLGNGTQSTLQNPSTVYITPGTYAVTLTASNASGSSTKTMTNFITVIPSPAVLFSATDSSAGCNSKTVQFTNGSVANSPGAMSYFWDFGDGSSSTAASPSHTYTAVGSYTVTLVVTNSAGCSKSLTKTNFIRVLNKPTAGFTLSNNNSCTLPLTVNFNNTSTGAASYAWDFGDGGTSTLASPTHVYTAVGSYNVRLIVTSAGGCKDTMQMNAAVNIGSLVAGFNQSATSACTGNTIAFNNTTVPGAGNSTWYFGDGTTANSSNATHSYSAPGTYTVKLIVQYNNCADSAFGTVTIAPGPTTTFTATPTIGCSIPFTTQFTNNTTGAVSYAWDFGDGTTSTAPNPSHTYSAYGNYTVRLISTSLNGCKDTMIRSAYIRVIQNPCTITSTNNSGCIPLTTSMALSCVSGINAASYSWNFGDGSPVSTAAAPSHTYTSAGTYTVTLNYTTTNGCSGTRTFTVSAQTKPVASFSGSPTLVCPNAPVSFTNTSQNATSYIWLFGDGTSSSALNPTHNYTNPGTYSVTLIASNGFCSDTMTLSNLITVNPPLAQFTTSYSCTNRRAWTFTNTSVGATSQVWNFGDGSPTTTVASPSHTFPANGTYTVTLTVSNGPTGCTNVYSQQIQIGEIGSHLVVSDSTICKGQAAVFTYNFTPLSTYRYVDFGNGFVYTSPTLGQDVMGFATPGYYTIKIVAGDAMGCRDSVTLTNLIQVGGPNVDFTGTPLTGCPPLNVNFTDLSTPNAGFAITNRVWSYGEGAPAPTNATSVSHLYNALGAYNVKLTVTDVTGCKDSAVKPAYINVVKPVAQFVSPDTNACVGGAVTFSNLSTPGSGLSYDWNFGDGGTSTAANPSHAYSANGSYTVRLIVTNASGCKDTLIRTNYIHINTLDAAFTMSDSLANCPPLNVNFTNNSVGATNYLWTFGNNSTSTLANPNTVFAAPGTYTVKLRAASGAGCADSATRTVTISGGPAGTFTYTPSAGCSPFTVTFTANAVNTTAFTWDLNNGVTQTTTSPIFTYTYNTPGVFLPKVVLSNGPNCNTSLVGGDTIKINRVTAGFTVTPNPVCAGTPVQFTDTSSVLTAPVTTRSWTFGDGGTSTSANPAHTYTTAGTYTVRLISGTANGCKDTAFRTVVVNPLPVVAAANQTVCAGNSAQLQASGAASYNWSPATGLSCTNCANPVATPPATTTYVITGTSAAGCVATGNVTVTVNPLPTVSAGANQSICNGGNVQLQASGASTYVWSPATGLSNANIANPVAAPTATTTYTVTGTTAAGCSATAQVTVSVGTVPTVTAGSNAAICAGGSTVLQGNGADSYTWTPATGLSCTNCSNPVASPAATTTYTVTGTAANGCSNTAQVTVSVNPLPTVSAGANESICAGGSVAMQATGAASYIWSPATGLSCINCAAPTASPAVTTTYTVTGTSAAGCTSTATKTITVNPLPAITAGADAAICAGGSTTLSAGGGVSYVWSPATGLSNANIANPVASPSATTTYIVTGTSALGCSKTDTVVVTVNPLPVVAAGPAQFICTGGSTTLQASGAASYVWSPATGLSNINIANPVASPAATTTYTVTGTSAQGCVATAQVTVTIGNQPVITVSGTPTICAGGSATLTASGAVNYSWSPATGVSNANIAAPTFNPATTTTYTVTGTSGAGCTGTAQVTVTVNPLPTVDATAAQAVICPGASTTLAATGASTYVWSPATGLSNANVANPVASPAATTTYTVTGTSAQGCAATDTVTVTVAPTPVVNASANQTICIGSSTTLQASGAVSYSWSPATGLSNTNVANPVASPTATTTYIVTGTSAQGCTDTAQVTVTVVTQPTITVAGTTAVCVGGSTTLTASGANTYSWSPATGVSNVNIAAPTFNPAATTTYTVTGTSGAGCTGTTQVTVTVNPLPTVAATATPASICPGGSSTLTAAGAATYSWSPAATLSNANIASPVATPTATTTYTVTGTSAQGCVNTDTVTVTVAPTPVVTVTPAQTICIGSSTTLQASGASTYVWSPATGLSNANVANPVASPAATTTYTVTGTNAQGCTATAQVTVNVVTQPTIAVAGNTAICAGASTTLTASGANTYSWSPATGVSNANIAAPTFNPAATTTYTVTGTSGAGCTGTAQVTVTVNPLPTVDATAAQAVICPGASTTLAATGASTYVWSPATGLSNANVANPVASPAATTTYTVTGTSAQGCAATDTVTVTVAPTPVVNASANQAICIGSSTTLQASGAVSYSWSPATGLSNANIANPVASPTATTTYIVTGTSAQGCTDTAQVTVTVVTQPTITVAGTTAVCVGGSTTLTASGANTYSWSPATGVSNVNIAAPTFNPAATTTYTVTGTSGAGCTGTTQVTVTVNPLPTVAATAAPASICPGGSSTLTAAGAATYVWSPAATLSNANTASPVASPAATTTYTVTGTSAQGCVNTATVAVNVLTPPTVTATSSVPAVCVGSSAQLTAGGAASYVWSPATGLSNANIANPVAAPTATTTYTVTGTGANGCTSTAQVTVTVNQPPVVNAGANTSICAGNSTLLTASGAATYVWSPATGLSNANIANPVAAPSATTTYTVTGTSAQGCVATAQVTVTVKPLPVVNAGAGQTACQGVPVQLQATGATSYSWSPSLGLSNANIANPVATPAATTTYTVTGTANGCSATSQVTVTINPMPVVNAGPDVNVCNGNGIQLAATGAVSYVWSPAAGLSCTTCPNPVATPATPTAYTVTGTGANGCTASDVVNVGFFPAANINAGADVNLCQGQSVVLQATGGVSYNWNPGTDLSCTTCASPSASPSASIVYNVVGTDANGCVDSDQVAVTVIVPQPVTVGENGEICEGESFQLSASGGSSYSWTPSASLSDASSASPVATPMTTTTYNVSISQSGCFDFNKQVTVTVHPKPTIEAGPDLHIIAGEQVRLKTTGTNIATYLWEGTGLSCTDCAEPLVTPIQNSTYYVTATSAFGCQDSDRVAVYVDCDNNQIWVPNTFTPNGDGENDWFYPHSKGVTTLKRFRIYDRWGELIFDRSDMPVNDRYTGWDGTFKNQPLKPDVYVYIIDATCSTGQPLQIRGDISLVR